jgi:hypothetical protein
VADNVASSRDIKEIERKILDQVSVFPVMHFGHALWNYRELTANPRIWNSN